MERSHLSRKELRFPDSTRTRLMGSETTLLRRTLSIVRDTADQSGAGCNIAGTTTTTRDAGRNRVIMTAARQSGPPVLRFLYRLALLRTGGPGAPRQALLQVAGCPIPPTGSVTDGNGYELR